MINRRILEFGHSEEKFYLNAKFDDDPTCETAQFHYEPSRGLSILLGGEESVIGTDRLIDISVEEVLFSIPEGHRVCFRVVDGSEEWAFPMGVWAGAANEIAQWVAEVDRSIQQVKEAGLSRPEPS